MDNLTNTEIVDVAKEKRKYFASFMWKLLLAIGVIFVIQFVSVRIEVLILSVIKGLGPYISFIGWLDKKGILDTLHAVFLQLMIVFGDSIGFLILFLTTRKSEKSVPEDRGGFNFGWFLVCFIICFGIGGLGTVLGAVVNAIVLSPVTIIQAIVNGLGAYITGSNTNVVQSLIYADDSWLYLFVGIIVVGILGPILEELIFRKFVIDHTSKYGFGASILLSALTFAIFHGNFQQFFYALGLGILFGYIYANTGKLRYTIGLHMLYNLYASALMPLSRKMINKDVLNAISMEITKLSLTLQTHANNTYAVQQALTNYTNNVSLAIAKHPASILGIFVTAGVNLFYIFLIILGVIFILAFLVKGLKVRKTMMLGEKGTKPAAMFNWASILFWVLGTLLFVAVYVSMYVKSFIAMFT